MRGTESARSMLSGPQQQLYGRLIRALPGHVILAQVALARLVATDHCAATGHHAAQRPPLVADFVVCRPDFTPVAVVECDEGGMPGDAQRELRRRKDLLLQAAGIKVIHVAAVDLPRESALRALIAEPARNAPPAPLMRQAS